MPINILLLLKVKQIYYNYDDLSSILFTFLIKNPIVDIMGYVYLLLSVDINGNEAYKIGITKNDPNKRLKQLSTGNSDKIQLLNYYQSENFKKVEKMMHIKYSAFKTEANNEWFSLQTEHVMSFLLDCKEAEQTIIFLLENNPFYK